MSESKIPFNGSFMFDVNYRACRPGGNDGNVLLTSLSKRELKMVFAEFCARFFYDKANVGVIRKFDMREYLSRIIADRNLDENPDDLIRDYSYTLGFMKNAGARCIFTNLDIKSYFAALFFVSEEYHKNWNVRELLSKEIDSPEVAAVCKFMYEINPDYCKKLVYEELRDMYDKWLKGDADNWSTFVTYMKRTYDRYYCMSNELVVFEYEIENKIKSPMMQLVHNVLYTLMPEESSDTKHTLSYSPTDKWPSDYNFELCFRLTDFIHNYDNDCRLNVLKSRGCVPEKITVTEPEWCAEYDDSGEMISPPGPMITTCAYTPTDGYELCIDSGWLGELNPNNKNKSEKDRLMCRDLRELLANEGIFLPYRDYQNLKVLMCELGKELETKSAEKSFGILEPDKECNRIKQLKKRNK